MASKKSKEVKRLEQLIKANPNCQYYQLRLNTLTEKKQKKIR